MSDNGNADVMVSRTNDTSYFEQMKFHAGPYILY